MGYVERTVAARRWRAGAGTHPSQGEVCCGWQVMLVGTAGKGVKAWHADTKRMVSHVRLDPAFPDVASLACSPAEPTFACASCSPGAPGAYLPRHIMRDTLTSLSQ